MIVRSRLRTMMRTKNAATRTPMKMAIMMPMPAVMSMPTSAAMMPPRSAALSDVPPALSRVACVEVAFVSMA